MRAQTIRLGAWLVCFLLGTVGSAQVVGYVDSVVVYRTDTIYFAFGSDSITAAARSTIVHLAGSQGKGVELYIEGHTDAVGSLAANESLAQRRAQRALEVAIASGWSPTSVELRHFGERRRAVVSEGREQRNRRVLLRTGSRRRYAVFRGRITAEDGLPVPGGVIAYGPFLRDSVRANDDGYYTLFLPEDEVIDLEVFAEGYFFDHHRLRIDADAPPLVTTLTEAAPGSRMNVRDLFFVGNSTNLLKESYRTMPRLLRFMRSNPEIVVELAGHVNDPGPKRGPGTWQYSLAEARAEFVHDYLIRFGIGQDRVKFRGYSNFEMVDPDPRNERERRRNRRVEIRVLGRLSQ